MVYRACGFLPGPCLLRAFLLLPLLGLAQGGMSAEETGRPGGLQGKEQGPDLSSKLLVSLHDEGGGDITVFAVVTLSTAEGRMFKQVNAVAGQAEFDGLTPGDYTIQVTAAGYDSLKQTINVARLHSVANVQLRRRPEGSLDQTAVSGIGGSDATASMMTTSVKEQRQMMRIVQALRDNKPQKARMDLEKLYLDTHLDSNLTYLYGLYEKEMKDAPKAKYYWQKAVALDPKHLAALMELGHIALDEGKPAEALPYLKRAAQASPTSWQPHAMMVVAYSKQKQYAQAVGEAERALELGHSQAAAIVQPVLASTLAAEGNKEQAIQVLKDYLREHPGAEDAHNLLAALQQTEISWPSAALPDLSASSFDFAPILPSAWMPSGVDDKVPPVEPGVPCSLDTILSNTSMRMTELVQNVDRFEATESLADERIGRLGAPSREEMRTYRYMVSIGEVRPGLLAVDEYRDARKEQDDPPNGVVTVGLSALALVFHPAQIENYKFTCEGLARTSTGLSWQVHFQQRADRVPTLRGYRLRGQLYAVGLRGRAWIAPDSFQIVRLETDLVKPYPEIRLAAEHTVIQYGPVRFRTKDVRMWLPQNAEVYFDWRGKRVHRRLSYSNYILFSVDSSQKIVPPKIAEAAAPGSSIAPAPPKP